MAEYTLLIILFAPFVGALALIFVSNRQLSLVRGIAADAQARPVEQGCSCFAGAFRAGSRGCVFHTL